MKKILGLAVAVLLLAGTLGGVTGTLTADASTTYVSKTYTHPYRGETSAGVAALQRRLVKAGVLSSRYVTSYFGPITEGAVKRFQRSHGLTANGQVNRTTWNALVRVTGTIKVSGSSGSSSSGKLDRRCKTGARVLCIDKHTDHLYYVQNGHIRQTLDVRFGCPATPTRMGLFHVNWKAKHVISTLYHTPMPYSMFFSGGEAVHYSADFAARGYAGCSHGCVNVRDYAGIRWLYGQIHVGDKVVVYRS